MIVTTRADAAPRTSAALWTEGLLKRDALSDVTKVLPSQRRSTN